MSAAEIKNYFDTYIFGFIFSDIKREIVFAKSRQVIKDDSDSREYSGGGNFLCALGLLCYTEFMGGIYKETFKPHAHILFDSFLHLMGDKYKEFDDHLKTQPSLRPKQRKKGKKSSVYEVFRCGMTHAYFIKNIAYVAMLRHKINRGVIMDMDMGHKVESGLFVNSLRVSPSMLIGPVDCGIGMLDDGRYFLEVETYFNDFAAACKQAYAEIMSRPNPIIPIDDPPD